MSAALDAAQQLGSRGRGAAGRARRVHQARKQLKLVRALVRSWREVLPASERRSLDRQARDLARALSGARDETVLRRTAVSLELDPDRLGLGVEAEVPWQAATLRSLQRRAGDLVDAVRARAPRHGGFDLLAPGLAHTWRAGREGFRACAPRPDPDALHEWRKAVKARMLQERMFVPAWPEVLGPVVHELDELQELLGAHHDLHVLSARIEARGELAKRIEDRQQELATRAVYLGERLYAGSARGWSALLAGCVRARWPAG